MRISRHTFPDRVSPADLDYFTNCLSQLRVIRLISVGDLVQHELSKKTKNEILAILQQARVDGNLRDLEEVYLLGRKVDDKAVEFAASLCIPGRLTSESSPTTLVIAHNKTNDVGDVGVLAVAKHLAILKLKTLVFFGGAIGDQGAVALAKSINGKTSLRRLVLYGKQISNASLKEFSSVLQTTQLEELVIGGTDFSDSTELQILLKTIWCSRFCKRLGLLNYNIGDSVAITMTSLTRETGYSPMDIVLLAGQATWRAFSEFSTCWNGSSICRLTLCSFLADDMALKSFNVRALKESPAPHALELICGNAGAEMIRQKMAEFGESGYTEAAGISDPEDLVAAAPGIYLSNAPGVFLDARLFPRVYLRGRAYLRETGTMT